MHGYMMPYLIPRNNLQSAKLHGYTMQPPQTRVRARTSVIPGSSAFSIQKSGEELPFSVPFGDGGNPSPSGEGKVRVTWSSATLQTGSAYEERPQGASRVDP